MAKFQVSGLSKVLDRLDSMDQAPVKVKKQLINKGANMVLEQMRSDATSQFNGTGTGARNLAIIEARNGESYLFMDVGIGEKNWYECRGLYFQHYGFNNNAPTLWMNSSFKRSKSKVSKLIKEGLKRELNLWLIR